MLYDNDLLLALSRKTAPESPTWLHLRDANRLSDTPRWLQSLRLKKSLLNFRANRNQAASARAVYQAASARAVYLQRRLQGWATQVGHGCRVIATRLPHLS